MSAGVGDGGASGTPPSARSAHPSEMRAKPASQPAPPPAPPLIAPTGSVTGDLLANVVNTTAAPWQNLPHDTPVQKVNAIVSSVAGVLSMKPVADLVNAGVAAALAPIAAMLPAFPAATLTAPHIGIPHTHVHPPSLVPPAPPIPLPSIGNVLLSGCVSVLIGGMPAARAGDLGMAFTCGSLSPAFEVFTGSSSVFIGGSRAARMLDITRHCGAAQAGGFTAGGAAVMGVMGALGAAAAPSPMAAAMAAAQAAADIAKAAASALLGKDPGAPPCIGALMMGNPTVMIGGLPVPPLEQWASRYCQKLLKPLADALHSIVGKTIKSDRLANFFHEAICHTTGHPVDVATGRVLTSGEDLRLPGPLPLLFRRRYSSAWSHRDGPLGFGWSHTFDQAVWVEEDRVVYRAEDGREIEFDLAADPTPPSWLAGNERWDRFNRLKLRSFGGGRWEVESADGLTREFGLLPFDARAGISTQPSGGSARDLARARLLKIRDVSGNAVTFSYDPKGCLEGVVDSAGRQLRFESNRAGRLSRLLVPNPSGEGTVDQARYVYSPAGDLAAAHDPLGHATTMEYQNHLLVRETNRNGLSFYFEYEGEGRKARCTKTWGDGDIYHRDIIYDVDGHTTYVTNSYDGTTVYKMNADNAVVSMTDPLGGVTKYEYDDSYQLVAETDPTGATKAWLYDERGALEEIQRADGTKVSLRRDERGLVQSMVVPGGAEWKFVHDRRGRLVAEIAPDGATTRLEYDGRGQRTAVVNPIGARTEVTYDGRGDAVGVRLPNGARATYSYDRLGRRIAEVNVWGGQRRATRDAAGRVVLRHEPDGDVVRVKYDPEGNTLEWQNRWRHIQYTWVNRSCLQSRTEAGETVRVVHDREDRPLEIVNELGDVHRVERDVCGQIVREQRFDGAVRKFERDGVGQVVAITTATGRRTSISYDPMGRITEVLFPDGEAAAYSYREDGRLVQARNAHRIVELERDLVGRIVREKQGDDWIEVAYDGARDRARVTTSLGLQEQIERDPMGNAIDVAFETAAAGARVLMTRDPSGLELERRVPGGVVSVWKRDQVGLPVTRELARGEEVVRGVGYRWAENTRLLAKLDTERGRTGYEHDDRARLSSLTFADREVQLRNPDPAGNLYRTVDRSDRVYSAGGRVEMADGVKFRYDEEGNLVERIVPDGGSWTYAYNGSGTLKKVTRPDGATVAFTYDAFGRRVEKRGPAGDVRWVWDGAVPVHEVSSERGVRTAVFEPESYAVLGIIEDGKAVTVLPDPVGAPAMMVGQGGEIVWEGELDGYGVNVAGPMPGEFAWPGQYRDHDVDLHYNFFRYYDPTLGVYLTPDPIGLLGGLRPYGYVPDPLVAIDPLGLDWNYRLTDSNGDPYYYGRASDNDTPAGVQGRHSRTKGSDGARFGDGDTLEPITPRGTDSNVARGVEQGGIASGGPEGETTAIGRRSVNGGKVRGNNIRGIDPNNPNAADYQKAAAAYLKAQGAEDVGELPGLTKAQWAGEEEEEGGCD